MVVTIHGAPLCVSVTGKESLTNVVDGSTSAPHAGLLSSLSISEMF